MKIKTSWLWWQTNVDIIIAAERQDQSSHDSTCLCCFKLKEILVLCFLFHMKRTRILLMDPCDVYSFQKIFFFFFQATIHNKWFRHLDVTLHAKHRKNIGYQFVNSWCVHLYVCSTPIGMNRTTTTTQKIMMGYTSY